MYTIIQTQFTQTILLNIVQIQTFIIFAIATQTSPPTSTNKFKKSIKTKKKTYQLTKIGKNKPNRIEKSKIKKPQSKKNNSK